MIKVELLKNHFSIDRLPHQWDLGQKLEIRGLKLDKAPEVHFANAATDPALVLQSELDGDVVRVDVPDILLQQAYTITAFIYITDGRTERTKCKLSIPVLPRIKPADYVYTPMAVVEEALDEILALQESYIAQGVTE